MVTRSKDLRTGRSVWQQHRAPPLPHRPLTRDLKTEVLVIGAGITGAMVADALCREGMDVVVVDRVGVLGDLYAVATAAFVGGAFHDAGLHSVLEPAAFGAPVMFGPRHTSSRDAGLLVDDDAAKSVRDSDELTRALESWLGVRGERDSAGASARRVVHRGLGAAERSYGLVAELMK